MILIDTYRPDFFFISFVLHFMYDIYPPSTLIGCRFRLITDQALHSLTFSFPCPTWSCISMTCCKPTYKAIQKRGLAPIFFSTGRGCGWTTHGEPLHPESLVGTATVSRIIINVMIIWWGGRPGRHHIVQSGLGHKNNNNSKIIIIIIIINF